MAGELGGGGGGDWRGQTFEIKPPFATLHIFCCYQAIKSCKIVTNNKFCSALSHYTPPPPARWSYNTLPPPPCHSNYKLMGAYFREGGGGGEGGYKVKDPIIAPVRGVIPVVAIAAVLLTDAFRSVPICSFKGAGDRRENLLIEPSGENTLSLPRPAQNNKLSTLSLIQRDFRIIMNVNVLPEGTSKVKEHWISFLFKNEKKTLKNFYSWKF